MTGARSTRRYQSLRTIGYVLFWVSLCLIAFVGYLQTPHAFTHVIVPFINSMFPGDLQVENGSLTLPASVEATGLSYRQPDTGVSVSVDRLHLSFAAMESLRQRRFFVDEATIDHGDIRIVLPPQEGETTVDAAPSSGSAPLRWAVRRLHVDGSLFVVTDSKEVAVTDVQVSIEDVGPGRSGIIAAQGEVALQQTTGEHRWAGRMVVTGSVGQDSSGRRIEWDTANELIVRDSPLSASGMPAGTLSVDQRVRGGYDLLAATLEADSLVTMRLGADRLVDASVKLRRTPSAQGVETDLGLKILEVTEQALNFLVDDEQAFRLRAAHVAGYVDVHAVGTRYAVRSVFAGEKLQVVFDHTATPPLDIDLAQTGTFDSDTSDLAVEIFDVHVADQQKIWLAGELKRTLTFRLGGGYAEREDVESPNSTEADWALRVNDVSVADMRRWFTAFHLKGLEGLQAGQVRGVITAAGRTGGKAVDLALRLRMSDLIMDSSEGREVGPPVTFEHVARATLIDFAELRISSFVTTASVLGERSTGTLELSGRIRLTDPAADLDLRGSLVLNDLHSAAFNPMLARWTKASFDHGHFNGTANATITRELLKWEVDLRGRRIRFRLPNKPRPTLPLEVVARQAGHVDRTARVLQIEKAVLQASEQSRPMLTVVLDHPIHVALSKTGRKPASVRTDSPLATLGIELHRLDIEQLRPRLEFLKLPFLDLVTSGRVDSRLTIHWWGEAEPLAVVGDLNLERMTLDSPLVKIGKPLTLRNRFEATVKDSTVVELTAWNLRAFNGATAVADARVNGTADLADGTMDLSTRFTAGDITEFLLRIGLLDKRQLKSVAGGAVTADVRASSQGAASPVSLRIGIRSRNLRFKALHTHVITYDVDVRGTVDVNGPRTVVDLNPLALTLKHAAKDAGTMTVWGRWPINASESEATARLVAKNVDCGPVIDLYGALPGRHPGPLPLSADVKLAMNTRSGQVAVSGQETIGPATVSRKDGGPAESTVRLGQDVLWHNQVLSVSKLTLTADRPNGTADHASANGRVNVGSLSQAEFEGKITSLDAAWYAALLSKPASTAQASLQAEGQSGPKPTRRPSDGKGAPANVLFKHLDGVLSIGSISYGGLKIGPGRLTMRGTKDRIDFAVEPTGLADGKVEATMALTGQEWQGGGTGRFEWTGRGEGLNIETLLKAVEPGEVARMSGLGSFQTSGSGVQGGTVPEEQMKGSLNFTITGGQFSRMPLASFLARETHVEEFNRMGFSEIRGDMRQEAGETTMDRLVAMGSVSSLEGSGKMGSDGALNGLIFVKIGPSFRQNIKIPCMSAILLLPDGFAALPFAVRVSGTPKAPVFSVDTSPWDQAKGTITGFAGRMKNLVMGCREAS